jgi:predicted amidohydrolase YtcJ
VPGAYFHRALPTEDGAFLVGATQSGTLETGIEAHAAIWEATARP